MTRLIPTSITTASGLTISAVIISGLPIAAINISALRVISARFLVREWAIVTVAFSSSNISATGLPTRMLRPITTAFLPASSILAEASSSITPAGVQLRNPSSPRASLPRLFGCRPSASLSGSSRFNRAIASRFSGNGN